MLSRKKTLDPSDFDIVLADDLEDEHNQRYTLTLKSALDEILGEEYLIACDYLIWNSKDGKKLKEFTGWTETKVIFCSRGIFYEDSLLSWVRRNPSL